MDKLSSRPSDEQPCCGPGCQQAAEPKGVQQAAWHQGVVTVLKKSYGFIRSAHCRGDIFFHRSSVAAQSPRGGSLPLNNAAGSVPGATVDTPMELAVGSIVSFRLSPAAGKLAAATVHVLSAPGTCANPLELVSNAVLVGRLARPATLTADTLIRYMEEGVVVEHITCTPTPALLGVPVGTAVRFRLLTDLKQLHASQASSSPHAWHAAHRATDVTVLRQEDEVAGSRTNYCWNVANQLPGDGGPQVVLPSAAQQQLLTLELLSTAFDADQQ